MLYVTKQQTAINVMVNAVCVTGKSYHKLYPREAQTSAVPSLLALNITKLNHYSWGQISPVLQITLQTALQVKGHKSNITKSYHFCILLPSSINI